MPDAPNSTQAAPSHGSRDHARFSPSSAKRWLNCPGSVPLIESMNEPRLDNAASIFGSRCHELAEQVLRGDITLESITDPEVLPHVKNYVDYIRSEIDFATQIEGDFVTQQVEVRLNTRIRDVWGTVDCLLLFTPYRQLIAKRVKIADLKTGRELIEAEQNEQMLTYAVGVLSMYPDVEEFTLVIAQATDTERPIKSWTCGVRDVIAHRSRIRQAIRDLTVLRMGDWCTWCPGRSRCRLHQAAASAVFDMVPATPEGGTLPTPEVITATAAGTTEQQRQFILQHRAAIERFMDAVVAESMRNPPPGWKTVRARGRATWRRDIDVQATCEMLNINPRLSMPTIGEVRRVAPHLVGELIETPEGRPTIVPESDPRPALPRGEVFIEAGEGE